MGATFNEQDRCKRCGYMRWHGDGCPRCTDRHREAHEMNAAAHTWIGEGHPPGWRRVTSIDVADPANTRWASENDYRIGAIYDGGTDSAVEPCCADVYERVEPEASVDQACIDLAKHFLDEVKGSTPADIAELAAALQSAAEDACGDVERRLAEAPAPPLNEKYARQP